LDYDSNSKVESRPKLEEQNKILVAITILQNGKSIISPNDLK